MARQESATVVSLDDERQLASRPHWLPGTPVMLVIEVSPETGYVWRDQSHTLVTPLPHRTRSGIELRDSRTFVPGFGLFRVLEAMSKEYMAALGARHVPDEGWLVGRWRDEVRKMGLNGSCLCGAVQYDVDQLDTPIEHCHCLSCRKAHAAAYSSSAGVMREHFRWTAGEEHLSVYESSPGKLRRFCSVCGTHLLAERVAQQHIILRVGTLDGDPGARPAMHIWTSHDVSWLVEDGEVPRYPEWPRSC